MALTTIALQSPRSVSLTELWVIPIGLLEARFGVVMVLLLLDRMFPLGVQMGMLVCLLIIRSRAIVPGCRKLVVISSGARLDLPS